MAWGYHKYVHFGSSLSWEGIQLQQQNPRRAHLQTGKQVSHYPIPSILCSVRLKNDDLSLITIQNYTANQTDELTIYMLIIWPGHVQSAPNSKLYKELLHKAQHQRELDLQILETSDTSLRMSYFYLKEICHASFLKKQGSTRNHIQCQHPQFHMGWVNGKIQHHLLLRGS